MSDRNLFVLDDEPDICELFKGLGTRVGYGVQCWQDPTAFLDECDCCSGERRDVIVLDIDLPGKDGIEVLRELALRECSAAILFVSGRAPRVLRSAAELGKLHGLRVLGALQKPFKLVDAERLLTQVGDGEWSRSIQRLEREPVHEDELEAAFAERQFVPYYQPQVSVESGTITGFEVLARWRHPRRGILAPGLFLPEISHLGLMDRLTDSMMRGGLRDLTSWNGAAANLELAFNVDSASLEDLEFPDQLVSLCRDRGVEPERLILELTESSMMEVPQITLDVLARVALRGIHLAIDDFGTGWSTHEQLRRVPFSELKIDRIFVTDCQRNEAASVILGSMVGLGQELGLRVLAEGVESAAELEELRRLGCHEVQGFHFSPPVPAGDVPALLDRAPL